jgi:putative transposase
MREWFTAAEILQVGSVALPTDMRALNRLIERNGWRIDERRARPRTGRGGGTEYHISLLPAEVQARLVVAQTAETPNARALSRSSALWARFEALPEKAKAKARRCLAIVERVDTLTRGGMVARVAVALVSHEEEIASSTIWTWLRAAGSVPAADRLAALAPRHQGRTLTKQVDPRAWSFLVADYLRPEQPAFEASHRRMCEAAAEQGWSPLPSAKTLKRRVDREIPRGARTLARAGADAARRVFPHQTRDRSVFSALQAVNADGHRFDVFVRWPDGTIARPVMVAVQDLFSGMILGHRIDATENWSAVRHAFADVVESFGIPEQCWLDNGRSFASKWISGGMKTRFRFTVRDDEPKGLLTQLGVQVHWATPYHGQAKPIERAFRDLCEEIAKHPRCAGAYTGNSPEAKPENYGSKAIPLDDFRAIVANEIARHNLRTGRRTATAKGRSFAATFKASMEADGALVRRATDAQRRMLLMAAEGVTARKPTGEVHLGENRYWAEPLVELMGKKVVARFDPDDLMAPVAVYTLDGRYLCEAPCIAATGFDDMDAAREHARRKRAWFKAQRELLDLERRMTIDEVARLLPKIDPVEPPPPTKVVRLVAAGAATPKPAAAEELWAGAENFGRAARMLEAGTVIPFTRNDGGDAA